jgi:hypothetical protein
VRPFNEREENLNSYNCVDMNVTSGQCRLKIDNNSNTDNDRVFRFDAVFDQE